MQAALLLFPHPIAVAAGKRPTCAVVITGPQEACESTNKEILSSLRRRCRPVGQKYLEAVMDGEPRQLKGIRRARRNLEAARTLFLRVRLSKAEQRARLAVSLYDRHHASLESYTEISEARMFLGVVLLEMQKSGEAADEFRMALAISPDFNPDPATVPPAGMALLKRVRFSLKTSPRGALSVKTDPAGSALRLDGTYVGKTPLSLTDLAPGNHYLTIRREGSVPWDGVVRIEPNQITSHEFYLKPTPRVLLQSSEADQIRLALDIVARATKAEEVILVRVDPVRNIDAFRVLVHRLGETLSSDPKTLKDFLVDVKIPPPPPTVPEKKDQVPPAGYDGSVLTSWWFWTLVGVVVVGTAVGVPLLVDTEDNLNVTVFRKH